LGQALNRLVGVFFSSSENLEAFTKLFNLPGKLA
jgi:hypothetical protein